MRKVTKETKLLHDKWFARMTDSAISGILLIVTGTISSILLFPQAAWLLTIFLVFVVIHGLLEKTEWKEKHTGLHFLFAILPLLILASTIAWQGYTEEAQMMQNLPLSVIETIAVRIILLILILVGSMEFFPLFQKRNYRYLEVED